MEPEQEAEASLAPVLLAGCSNGSAKFREEIGVELAQTMLQLCVMQGDGKDFVVGIGAGVEGTTRVEITATDRF